MIPIRRPSQPRFLAPLVLVLPMLLASCASDRETTISRSARAREAGAFRAERRQLERESEIWRATRDEALAEIAAVKAQSVRSSSQLRAVRAELLAQLLRLQQGEQDLELTKARAVEIEVELAPLRALETTLQKQQELIDEAASRVLKLEAESTAATAAAAKQEAVLVPKLTAVQKRLAELKAAGVAIADVEAKIATAVKALTPAKK